MSKYQLTRIKARKTAKFDEQEVRAMISEDYKSEHSDKEFDAFVLAHEGFGSPQLDGGENMPVYMTARAVSEICDRSVYNNVIVFDGHNSDDADADIIGRVVGGKVDVIKGVRSAIVVVAYDEGQRRDYRYASVEAMMFFIEQKNRYIVADVSDVIGVSLLTAEIEPAWPGAQLIATVKAQGVAMDKLPISEVKKLAREWDVLDVFDATSIPKISLEGDKFAATGGSDSLRNRLQADIEDVNSRYSKAVSEADAAKKELKEYKSKVAKQEVESHIPDIVRSAGIPDNKIDFVKRKLESIQIDPDGDAKEQVASVVREVKSDLEALGVLGDKQEEEPAMAGKSGEEENPYL